MGKLLYQVVGTFEFNGNAERVEKVADLVTSLGFLMEKWSGDGDMVNSEVRVKVYRAQEPTTKVKAKA